MRYLATIQYDGRDYHGWQVQNNAITVQQTVQEKMSDIFGYSIGVTGCSRTDSKVHALKFCYHFDYDGNISENSIIRAMNSKLPTSIRMLDVKQVADDFHARYSVKSKEYTYVIDNGRYQNPFTAGLATHINIPLDEKLMDYAAKQFVGTYDFSAFCASGTSVEDFVRTVYSASVTRQDDRIIFKVSANGFLYNMVRIMVGTLLYVSYGKIDKDSITDIILSKDRKKAGITAKPDGLYLSEVVY